MTDSDWVSWEKNIRVTWYDKGKMNSGCQGHCKSVNGVRPNSEREIFWVDIEGEPFGIMLCVDCWNKVTRLIEILKESPKCERFYDEQQAKDNDERRKKGGFQVLADPNKWRIPDIQRRFLDDEL